MRVSSDWLLPILTQFGAQNLEPRLHAAALEAGLSSPGLSAALAGHAPGLASPALAMGATLDAGPVPSSASDDFFTAQEQGMTAAGAASATPLSTAASHSPGAEPAAVAAAAAVSVAAASSAAVAAGSADAAQQGSPMSFAFQPAAHADGPSPAAFPCATAEAADAQQLSPSAVAASQGPALSVQPLMDEGAGFDDYQFELPQGVAGEEKVPRVDWSTKTDAEIVSLRLRWL